MLSRSLKSSTLTSSPESIPSTFLSISTMPSALTILIIAAAPLSRGVAKYLPSMNPSATRKNSRLFSDDTTRFVSVAVTYCLFVGGVQVIFSITGFTTLSITVYAETGYPGTPMTGLSSIIPSTVGFPGFIASPCATTVPRCPIIFFVKSFVPAEEPALISTTSWFFTAFFNAFSIRVSSSRTTSNLSGIPPYSSISAQKTRLLLSISFPTRTSFTFSTISSPVGIIATFGFFLTVTVSFPDARIAPISMARIFLFDGMTISFATTVSPTARICCHGCDEALIITFSPSATTFSIIITLSYDGFITPPVLTYSNSSFLSVTGLSSLASTVSSERTAIPSIADAL